MYIYRAAITRSLERGYSAGKQTNPNEPRGIEECDMVVGVDAV